MTEVLGSTVEEVLYNLKVGEAFLIPPQIQSPRKKISLQESLKHFQGKEKKVK